MQLAAQKGSPDDLIYDQVRMKLTTDADVKGGALDITVRDGMVTIKGRVDTERGKAMATKLAKKVKGVKNVENQLVIVLPAQEERSRVVMTEAETSSAVSFEPRSSCSGSLARWWSSMGPQVRCSSPR